ncbi:hypothetical protein [Hydrogenophaga palleronii]|uniref:hypothetical protein n=1 Tax=Hydrogenophaga palleronii TaxID=65655 RepID=UPI000824D340|nr:hypothetical protein [Hydrogenophaga palleronii]
MSSPLFQKTALGRAEIVQRSARVPAAMRSVLIMVNGKDSADTLAARGLPGVPGHLQALLAQGLIEPVAPPPPPPPPPPPAPAPATTEVPLADAAHEALCRQAMARLSSHFGADTTEVVQALFAARTVAAFNAALDGIESRLSAHMGRKHAARELQSLRPLP